MLHKNPLIAFRRLCRLYGGLTVAVVLAPLIRHSLWFGIGALLGIVLMLSVVLPVHHETMRSLKEAEKRAEDHEPRSQR